MKLHPGMPDPRRKWISAAYATAPRTITSFSTGWPRGEERFPSGLTPLPRTSGGANTRIATRCTIYARVYGAARRVLSSGIYEATIIPPFSCRRSLEHRGASDVGLRGNLSFEALRRDRSLLGNASNRLRLEISSGMHLIHRSARSFKFLTGFALLGAVDGSKLKY